MAARLRSSVVDGIQEYHHPTGRIRGGSSTGIIPGGVRRPRHRAAFMARRRSRRAHGAGAATAPRPGFSSRGATAPCTRGSSRETATSPSPATARATTERPVLPGSRPLRSASRQPARRRRARPRIRRARTRHPRRRGMRSRHVLLQSVDQIARRSRALRRDEIRIGFSRHQRHRGTGHPRGFGTPRGKGTAEDEGRGRPRHASIRRRTGAASSGRIVLDGAPGQIEHAVPTAPAAVLEAGLATA